MRTLLIDTAERLWGAEPREAVSLRAIAREAGVAPGALTHHFADRGDLLEALIAKRFGAVAEATSVRLTALIEQEAPVGVDDVIVAALQPLIDVVNADPVSGFWWLRVFCNLGLMGSPVWRKAIVAQTELEHLYSAAAARAMPNLTDIEVRSRTVIALFSAMAALANADSEGLGHPLGPDGLDPLFVQQLLLFTSAGLAATPFPKSRATGRRHSARRAKERLH
ncbi:TetR/AcrR family transcriptional regulator [Mycobacterium terramassiliense]|uniref:TetR/AcrR family transcriptional regulator n=1 Tax=Mycobacterium terramassiliense TaxID=1841859 RepID=UPI0012FFA3C8|nr:TetR/AcrR family transcriptional regulator [Mycobacterium terramassiliense]